MQLVEYLPEFRAYLREVGVRKGFLRPDQDIQPAYCMMFLPEDFPQDAFHVVALYGEASGLFSDDQADAGMTQRIRLVVHRQDRSRNAFAEIKNG